MQQIQGNPNISKVFLAIVELFKNDGIRRLRDIYVLYEKEIKEIAEACPFEFCAFEDIIESVFENIHYDGQQEYYYNELIGALENLWPPKLPDILTPISKLLGGWSGTCYVIDFDTLPEDIKKELSNIPPLTCQQIISCLDNTKNDLQSTLSGCDLTQENKIATSKLKAVIGTFRKHVSNIWSSPKKFTTIKLNNTDVRNGPLLEFMESFYHYDAICDLIFGKFTDLDPVIGDEACEARPSALMDIYFTILSLGKFDALKLLASGYLLRHLGDPGSNSFRKKEQRQSESQWSLEFMHFCDKAIIPKCKIRDCADFLKFCKANTLASTMASDEWQIVSYDRDKGVYNEFKPFVRSHLSTCSATNILEMARFVCSETDNPVCGQVLNVLSSINAYKIDEHKKTGNNAKVCTLPIYETMRTVLAYELLQGRPLVFSIYEIIYNPANNGTYTLNAVHTLAYKANQNSGCFDLCDIGDLNPTAPCLSFQCYRFINPSMSIPITDGSNFFAESGDLFLNAFKTCDIALQVMIYSAIHPVLAGGAILEGERNEAPNHGRDYELMLQNQFVGDDAFGHGTSFTRTSINFNLLTPVCDLAFEHQSLLNLALDCELGNKQLFVERPGGGQVCLRTLDSCAFSIHHINMQSPIMIMKRDNEARSISQVPLLRFHNFDNKKSYDNFKDAEEKK